MLNPLLPALRSGHRLWQGLPFQQNFPGRQFEMKVRTCLKRLVLALVLLTAPVNSFADTNGLVASWHFDEGSGRATTEAVSGRQDPFVGHLMFAQGVRGSGLKFDGFTSRLARPAKELPKVGPALTVEAWVAPQEYSWAWTGIVDHDQDARAGFFLGINHFGQVGLLRTDVRQALRILACAHSGKQ